METNKNAAIAANRTMNWGVLDDDSRVNETVSERNEKLRAALIFAFVFAVALTVRWRGELPPFDDAYHLKRIESGARAFDPDRGIRGAFCPWPPLYDITLAAIGHVQWIPPLFFSLFAGAVPWVLGGRSPGDGRVVMSSLTAGLTLALSPYLIGISRRWHIDHHYIEPLLLLLIIGATLRRRGMLLGFAIALALLVQPALLAGAGVAFVVLFFSERPEEGAKAFALAAVIIGAYRLAQPSGYPESPWFLGYPHVAVLAGAAIACALRGRLAAPLALAAGAAIAATSPAALQGLSFFHGDPWLRTIVEFQPMFRDPARWGTDLANLTGGALLWRAGVSPAAIGRLARSPSVAGRDARSLRPGRPLSEFALFAAVYLLLALSSRRFLVVAIPLIAINAALFVAQSKRRFVALAAAAATLLPPLVYDVATLRQPDPSHAEVRKLAESVRALPPGRVLAPWTFGHAIDVLGKHPVVIDNFGPVPDPELFRSASFALDQPDPFVRQWCRERNVRYVRRSTAAASPVR